MKESKISAGSYDLNKWLFGGYDKEIITTIYGPAGSGKTNFCLLVAVSQASKGKKVIFIDTEGGFSVERVKQLSGNDNVKYKGILENILLMKPTNFEEQKKAFQKLLIQIKNTKDLSLIVVDGMTMLYRLELGEVNTSDSEIKGDEKLESIRNINRELARQLRILSEIARKNQLPVIVTNQVYNYEGSVRMVGGDILKYWSKCLIELENNNGKRKATIRKHRSLKEKELVFYISDLGIKKRGWI